MVFPAGTVDSDTFVLALPMSERAGGLALLAFIGGLSAATGMVIVETHRARRPCSATISSCRSCCALRWLRLTERGDLDAARCIAIRRGSIALVLLLGYLYFHFIGGSYALVSIGLLSFAAVAQFAPAIIGGMYWKGAHALPARWPGCRPAS